MIHREISDGASKFIVQRKIVFVSGKSTATECDT